LRPATAGHSISDVRVATDRYRIALEKLAKIRDDHALCPATSSLCTSLWNRKSKRHPRNYTLVWDGTFIVLASMDTDVSISDSERRTDTMQAPKPRQCARLRKLDKAVHTVHQGLLRCFSMSQDPPTVSQMDRTSSTMSIRLSEATRRHLEDQRLAKHAKHYELANSHAKTATPINR
jgi:hypothetical protein